jgi:hypothetical protein
VERLREAKASTRGCCADDFEDGRAIDARRAPHDALGVCCYRGRRPERWKGYKCESYACPLRFLIKVLREAKVMT